VSLAYAECRSPVKGIFANLQLSTLRAVIPSLA